MLNTVFCVLVSPRAYGWWLAFIAGVALACVRDNANHCVHRGGDAFCAAQYRGLDFCSSCHAAFEGCVETAVKACRDDDSDDAAATATSTGDDPGQTSVVTADPTVDPDDGDDDDDPTMDPNPTMTADGDDDGPPPSECGNGVVEGDEICDGDDLDGQDCSVFAVNGGTLACTADCIFDPSGCDGFMQMCGDGSIDPPEQCDQGELGDATCESVNGAIYGGGMLACSTCLFDTSNCCLKGLQPCEVNEDCCSGVCLDVALAKTCGL